MRAADPRYITVQRPTSHKSQVTSHTLLAALFEACQEDARFSLLKETPYVKEDRLADDLTPLTEREIRSPYNVTCALSWGMVG
jgi:hypothetical protein